MRLVLRCTVFLTLGAAALLAAASCGSGEPDHAEAAVFAAASLRDVLQDLAGPFEDRTGVRAVFNFAGSNVLAQQIEAAPAADVFLSANEDWMDSVEKAGRIAPETRRVFLSNSLVVIAQRDNPIRLESPQQLGEASFRFLSLGDPEAVPAGRYARQYLQSVDGTGQLWDRLKDKVAPAPDVRAALALVEADPEILGIVYRSDALSSKRVRVIYEVPPGKGPEIRYSGAVVRGGGNSEAGKRFLEFLSGDEAAHVFEEYGFRRWAGVTAESADQSGEGGEKMEGMR